MMRWMNAVSTPWMRMGLLGAAALALSSCAAFETRIETILPFKDKKPTKEIKEDESRISILNFEQSLKVSPTLAGVDTFVPTPVPISTWTQAGGGPTRVVGNAMATGPLEVLWKRGVVDGSGRYDRLTAQPVVDQGRMFIFDSQQRLYAFDVRSGDKLWSYEVPSIKGRDKVAIGGGVATSGGRVYITSGFGGVFALDAQSGQVIWAQETSAPMSSAPAVASGRVFAISDENEIYAFDTLSGEVLWTYQSLAESARVATSPAPAVFGDTVVAPFGSGEVIAIRAESGRDLWVEGLTRAARTNALASINDIAGGVAVSEGTVYAASHSGVMSAIDLRTGTIRWSVPAGSIQTPYVAGDAVYLVTTDQELVALNKDTGNAFWIRPLPTYEKPEKKKGRIVWAGPVMLDGRLVVVSTEGFARVFDAKSGEPVKTIKLGAPAYISPVVVDESALVLLDNGDLVAIR